MPPTQPSQQADLTAISLDRLLSRLEHTLLSPDGDPLLRKSSFERTKVGANLEHARSLLLRLEHESANIRIQSKKQEVQSSLQPKRETIKRLNRRLHELNQLNDSDDEDSASASEEDSGIFPTYAPARHDANSGLERTQGAGNEAFRNAAEGLTSTLRARRPQPEVFEPTGASTGTTTGRAFPSSASANPNADRKTVQTEALLDHNRNQQEDITASLLSMTQALKAGAVKFSQTLQAGDADVDRATEGLDKNAMGMQAAGGRMTTLRRMVEGKGWFARLRLYGLIAGLWLLAFAIVFIMPKLRF